MSAQLGQGAANFRLFLFCLALLLNVLALPAKAQSAAPQEAATPVVNDSDAANSLLDQVNQIKTIDVTNQVADESIASRITNILKTSDWFVDLEVSVAEGIVILKGKTVKRDHRQWAETIASRTQGAVAVINKIQLVQDPQGRFSPVMEESRQLLQSTLETLPALVLSFFILVLTWMLARYVAGLSHRLLDRRVQSRMLRRLVARLSAVPLVLIGIYVILNITGLGTLAATVIGGTGLLGLVIGFAFRDIAENFLASILISIQRPFRLGDAIKVLDFTGVVQAVTTRGTIIMTYEGNHVQIPNTIIYKEPIVNFTANPLMRLDFTVGIGYDASISKAQTIAMAILEEHPAVLNTPEPWVLAEALAASTVNLRIYFWVNSREHSVVKVKSAIIRIVKYEFIRQGISMPDDAREVIFPQGIKIETANLVEQPDADLGATAKKSRERKSYSTRQLAADRLTSTTAEGELTTDVPMLKDQAENCQLGVAETNLLR